jgi:hypothetical protein
LAGEGWKNSTIFQDGTSLLFFFFSFYPWHGKKFQQLKQSYTWVKWVKKKLILFYTFYPRQEKKIVQYNRLCTGVKREKSLSYHEKVGWIFLALLPKACPVSARQERGKGKGLLNRALMIV